MLSPAPSPATGEDRALLDELFDHYLNWREACEQVGEAFGRWRLAGRGEKEAAFAAYGQALDYEQAAGDAYVELMRAADLKRISSADAPSARHDPY